MYDATIDGATFLFGTSGFLYQSNKLMYDRTTRTLWHAFTGEPVVGRLALSGLRLRLLPASITTWGAWLAEHPETTVVSLETGYVRDYRDPRDPGAAYFDYAASSGPLFAIRGEDPRLPPKELVFGLQEGSIERAFPLRLVERFTVINDSMNGENVLIVGFPTPASVRAYRRSNHEFRVGAVSGQLVDEAGHVWRIDETGLTAISGESRILERLAGQTSYWFAWYAFHPSSGIYGSP
ncbi:MAG: DUF3179 domain-containing protein [Chloroflexi bacterium]|nr:DUF3179 domain-containing protein [Chloroflexota bacterium]